MGRSRCHVARPLSWFFKHLHTELRSWKPTSPITSCVMPRSPFFPFPYPFPFTFSDCVYCFATCVFELDPCNTTAFFVHFVCNLAESRLHTAASMLNYVRISCIRLWACAFILDAEHDGFPCPTNPSALFSMFSRHHTNCPNPSAIACLPPLSMQCFLRGLRKRATASPLAANPLAESHGPRTTPNVSNAGSSISPPPPPVYSPSLPVPSPPPCPPMHTWRRSAESATGSNACKFSFC